MARPASKPDWAFNNPNFAQRVIEPTAQKKQRGWDASERPPSEFMNWLFNNISEWIEHFDETNASAVTLRQTFDAILGGTGSTHVDLNAVMSDAALPAQDLRILIAGPQVFAATQIINKDGVEIFGTPGGTMSRGGNTVTGIQVENNRVKIRDCRFLNWDRPAGAAIKLTGASKNCLIVDNSFHDVSGDVVDDGENNIIANNIIEVD